jgi:hypothetical protein
VSALANGTASIIASSGGRADTSVITVSTVSTAPAAVATVTLSPSTLSLAPGATSQLSATLRDASGNTLTGRTVTWSISNSFVATVSSTGLVTGVGAGSTVVTATSEGRSATSNVTVTTPSPVIPPGTQPPLLWSSDWSLATGESSPAVNDGGRWEAAWNTEDMVTVVPATGLQFPSSMPNVLAIRYTGTRARGVIADGRWAPPAVGETLYFRFYWRMAIDASAQGTHHPLGTRPNLGGFAMVHDSPAGSPDFLWFVANGHSNFALNHRWETRLSKHTTYRIEWAISRTGSSTYRWQARVYDSAGTLIRGLSDFRCAWGHAAHTLADQPDITFDDAASFANLFVSHQGDWQVAGPNNRMYYGGFAVSKAGWVGPHIAGEGR